MCCKRSRNCTVGVDIYTEPMRATEKAEPSLTDLLNGYNQKFLDKGGIAWKG